MKPFSTMRVLVFGISLVALLSLNLATVAFSSVALLVSGAYETLTGATAVVGSLRRDLDHKSKTVATMADELDISNQRVRGLQLDLDQKTTMVASMTDDLEVRNQHIKGLSKALTIKSKEVSNLTGEVAKLKQSSTVTYRGQQKLLSEAVKDFSARVSRRTATSAARNAGSVVAEAIPFAGIAAIVGVTAWDLNDSCETMKDLHELNVAFNPDLALAPDIKEVCGLEVPSSEEVWQMAKRSPRAGWENAKIHVNKLPDLTLPSLSDIYDMVRFWQ